MDGCFNASKQWRTWKSHVRRYEIIPLHISTPTTNRAAACSSTAGFFCRTLYIRLYSTCLPDFFICGMKFITTHICFLDSFHLDLIYVSRYNLKIVFSCSFRLSRYLLIYISLNPSFIEQNRNWQWRWLSWKDLTINHFVRADERNWISRHAFTFVTTWQTCWWVLLCKFLCHFCNFTKYIITVCHIYLYGMIESWVCFIG